MGLVGWKYKREVQLINTTSFNLENYIVGITLDSSNFDFSKARFDGSDIRFTGSDGVTLLDYWIKDYNHTNQKATIWIKIPSIPANQTKSIYIYYGNMNATSQSNESIMMSGFLYNPDPFNDGSCLAFYPLDGNGDDYSGNGNDAVIHGNVGFTTGKLGQAVDYVNKTENDYIVTTNPIQRHGSKEITICGWINVAGHTGDWVNIWHLSPDGKDDSGNSRQPTLWLDSHNNSKFHMSNDGIHTGNLGIYLSQGSITYNQWHFICQVVTLRQMRLYIDGQLTDTYDSNEDFKFNDGWLYIGDKWYIKNHLIDHVRVFNRALTEDEISLLSTHIPSTILDEVQVKSRVSGVIVDINGNPMINTPIKIYLLNPDTGHLVDSTDCNTDASWEINDVPAEPGEEVISVFKSNDSSQKLTGAGVVVTQEVNE